MKWATGDRGEFRAYVDSFATAPTDDDRRPSPRQLRVFVEQQIGAESLNQNVGSRDSEVR